MDHPHVTTTLARWRPSLPDQPRLDPDPELAQAHAAADADPHLAAWRERHARFQEGTRLALRNLPVPGDLADSILANARSPILRPAFPTPTPAWLAAAAAVAALVVAAFLILRPTPNDSADFTTFRHRMVRAALREYRMDVTTPDLAAIRTFLAQNQAPADFQLPPGLAQLPAVGAGTLAWKDGRSAMVCLDAGADGMFYLFVVPSAKLAGPPPDPPEFAQVNRLSTRSWTLDDRTYVLATTASPEALKNYF